MKKQSGFTLVELVIVIVILGILAAYAIPKYMSIDKEARIAVIKGLEGSIRSASDIVYALSVAKNQLGTAGNLNVGPGASDNVYVLANGYPSADAVGITSSLTDVSGFDPDTSVANKITYKKTGSANSATCYVSYTNAGTANTRPTIAKDVSGC